MIVFDCLSSVLCFFCHVFCSSIAGPWQFPRTHDELCMNRSIYSALLTWSGQIHLVAMLVAQAAC
jgi:hypothetical protein